MTTHWVQKSLNLCHSCQSHNRQMQHIPLNMKLSKIYTYCSYHYYVPICLPSFLVKCPLVFLA